MKLFSVFPWRADWSGGKLQITHYNPNGSAADSLHFDSVENLCDWIEAHPDCCDVDKLATGAPEAPVRATTAPDKAATTTGSGSVIYSCEARPLSIAWSCPPLILTRKSWFFRFGFNELNEMKTSTV